MKSATILLTLFTYAAPVIAAEPKPVEPPLPKGAVAPDPSMRRNSEFSGDPIDIVLRALSRVAQINIIVDPSVSGTVNLRVENKTPLETIHLIAQAHGLIIEEKNGVHYVRSKNSPSARAETKSDDRKLEDEISEKLGPVMTRSLLKFHDALLEHQAQPETAKKVAKAKKALFQAFLAEGFSRDEALRLVISDRGVPPLSE